MKNCSRYRVWGAFCLLFLCLGFGPATVAHAKVHINGRVQLWRPDLNQYTPLKRVRVRMVLAEDYDSDTGDVETTCNDNGDYAISKGNPWWRQSYKAYPIVFAEVPDRLEVQDSYPQIDGYQAATGHVKAKQNKTTTINVNIGGPQSNVNYHVGGLAVLDNASSTSADRGWRAFYLCDIATDHRLRLMSHGFGTWEEKELVYPQNDSAVASYMRPWDYIRVPEGNFGDAGGVPGLTRVSKSVRHEMSHGLMADVYWTWPGVFHPGSNPDSHTLDQKDPTREFAWSEAWAEFMGQVTQNETWGAPTVDLETQNGSWHKLALKNGDATYIEGEIAASLWDIYDGTGTEECLEQNADVPGTETFVDRIGGGLDKIRAIFEGEHPHSFTHESFLGSSDSLVWYWVHKQKFGQPHELKTILFNRNIRVNEIAQTKPGVSMGAATWSKFDLKIPYQVTENDAEDRPFVTVKLYAGQTLLASRTLSDGWSGNANKGVFALSYGAQKGAPVPKFTLAASDEMQTVAASQTLNPPADATIAGVSAQFIKLEVPPVVWKNTIRQVSNLRLTLRATQGDKTNMVAVPGQEFQSPKGSDGIQFIGTIPFVYYKSAELFRTMSLDKPVQIVLDIKGSVYDNGGPVPYKASVNLANLSAETGFGVGTRTYSIAVRPDKTSSSVGWVDDMLGGANKMPPLHLLLTMRVEPVTSLTDGIDFSKLMAVLSPPVVFKFFPLDDAPKAPPEPSPGAPKAPPATEAAAMSRANSVIKQVARLQAEASEINSELEWKLSPQGLAARPVANASDERGGDIRALDAPADAPIRAPKIAAIQAGRFAVPTLSAPTFLASAARGQGLTPSLSVEAKEGLQELATRSQQIETRLQGLSVEAAALQNQLQKASQGFLNPQQLAVRAPDAGKAPPSLTAMIANLAQVAPAVAASRPILAQQREVVAQGLKLVGAPNKPIEVVPPRNPIREPIRNPIREPMRPPIRVPDAPITNPRVPDAPVVKPRPDLKLPRRGVIGR